MNDPTNNLLLNLFYGTWKKDENFHTEALVHFLRHLLRYDPVGAINILKAITNGLLVLSLDDVNTVSINTQIRTSKGFRPDVEIRTLTHLIYIEVKVEASLHEGQLEEYCKALEDSGFSNTSLILLTKYPFNPENDETPDHTIRWYQVAEWLEQELEQNTIQQSLSVYLAQQFLGFLRERSLTVERVSEELVPGVHALLNLVVMLEEALRLVKASAIKFDLQWEWIGYSFKYDYTQYWIGLRYDRPNILMVEIDEINPTLYEKLSVGYVSYVEGYEYEYWIWTHELDMSSETTPFFKLSKSAQLQRIEQFLKDSFDAVKQLSLS
ncbi:MAG: PD-(D/E)XK nuclease family protein [Anaerolineales bacterium]|nr:PD-(D/E)XK nuclease family protein [Anaerolineales bacterium]